MNHQIQSMPWFARWLNKSELVSSDWPWKNSMMILSSFTNVSNFFRLLSKIIFCHLTCEQIDGLSCFSTPSLLSSLLLFGRMTVSFDFNTLRRDYPLIFELSILMWHFFRLRQTLVFGQFILIKSFPRLFSVFVRHKQSQLVELWAFIFSVKNFHTFRISNEMKMSLGILRNRLESWQEDPTKD